MMYSKKNKSKERSQNRVRIKKSIPTFKTTIKISARMEMRNKYTKNKKTRNKNRKRRKRLKMTGKRKTKKINKKRRKERKKKEIMSLIRRY